jgi:hypothetical protein
MSASRSISRAVGNKTSLVPQVESRAVFDALRSQIRQADRCGISHAQLARAIVAILDGESEVDVGVARPLAHRLAWIVTVHAPAYDPVLVTTIPFFLENIVDGYATLDDLFEHIESSEPVEDAPWLPEDLPLRSVEDLEPAVVRAAASLREDPDVLERIVERLCADDREVPATGGGTSPSWSRRRCVASSVVSRWPTSVRDAVVSVLQLEPLPGALPLMGRITERLDARSVRRLAGELVHVSADESSLRLRVRAAESLLEMHRSGQLNRF